MIEIFSAIAPLSGSCDPVSLLTPPGDLSQPEPHRPCWHCHLDLQTLPSHRHFDLEQGDGQDSGTAPRRVVPCVSDTSDRLFEQAVAADQGMMSRVMAYHDLRAFFPVAGFAADWLPCIRGTSPRAASIHACQQQPTKVLIELQHQNDPGSTVYMTATHCTLWAKTDI
jgi:hypothetical protein